MLAAVVVGGGIGPVLLVAGLARTSAATASILLNTELAATALLAAVVFREHLGRRLIASAVTISVAGVLLVATPSSGIDVGALLVIGACLCWGYDNGVTAQIEQLRPEHVVFLKGLVAGSANLLIGLVTAGLGLGTDLATVMIALAIGAAGYGLSITLWVLGARDLGAARAQVIFSTAPFVGVLMSWALFGNPVEQIQLFAVAMAAVGVALSLGTGHLHRHAHGAFTHEHEHRHPGDEHHEHDHAVVVGRHSHPHQHTIVEHEHLHVPDLHHRHDHQE